MEVCRAGGRLGIPGLYVTGDPGAVGPRHREFLLDAVGLGRMVLAYPELPADVLQGRPLQRRRICRTFSDCTSAPRAGLVSGCYPLDPHYKNSEQHVILRHKKR